LVVNVSRMSDHGTLALVLGESVTVPVSGGDLVAWVDGRGPAVLLLHGGPGMSCGYVEDLAVELRDGHRTALYQQRGLAPSTLEGPFEIAQEIADVAAILDRLGWDRATVVGHSWGGHLALHLAVAIPGRLTGVLAVDPLGVIDPDATSDPGADLFNRIPEADAARARWLDERAMRGEGTAEDLVESFRLVWPAYLADPSRAPPPPTIRMSLAAYTGLWKSILARMAQLRTALPAVRTPVGVVVGEHSPFHPAGGATATAALIPGAWSEVIMGAGHLPWIERPGAVEAALRRLGPSRGEAL
jgi:pimeloyl-ACP methyl ester carboxylesterase